MTLLRPRCLKNELIGNENSWTSALLRSTGFSSLWSPRQCLGLSKQHQQRRCGKPGAWRVWAGLPEASPSECCNEEPQGSLCSGLSSYPGPGRPAAGSQALQAFGSDPSPSLRNPVPRDRAPGHGSWSQVNKARWGLLPFSSSPNTEKVSEARTLRTWDYSLHVTGRRRDAWEGSCFAPDHYTAGWWGYRWEETSSLPSLPPPQPPSDNVSSQYRVQKSMSFEANALLASPLLPSDWGRGLAESLSERGRREEGTDDGTRLRGLPANQGEKV